MNQSPFLLLSLVLFRSTPGSHTKRKKRRSEAVKQLAQNDGGAISPLVRGADALQPSDPKYARSSSGELKHTSGVAASGSFVLDTPDKKKGISSGTDLLAPPSEAAAASCRSPTSPVQPAEVAVPSRPLSARQHVFAELVQTEENYVNMLRYTVLRLIDRY